MPRVHLVNPSTESFGVAVITPRWSYVLAAATGSRWGDPQVVDETLEAINFDTVAAGDVVGIGIGYEMAGSSVSVVRGSSTKRRSSRGIRVRGAKRRHPTCAPRLA